VIYDYSTAEKVMDFCEWVDIKDREKLSGFPELEI